VVVFEASHFYGLGNSITVLHANNFSTISLTKIRIKENSTFDGAALQIYVANASNSFVTFLLGDNFLDGGWVLENYTSDASAPTGITGTWASYASAAEVDVSNLPSVQGGMITTGEIWTGDATTQYRVLTTNDAVPLADNSKFYATADQTGLGGSSWTPVAFPSSSTWNSGTITKDAGNNTFTIGADGVWRIECNIPYYQVGGTIVEIRIVDVTSGTVVLAQFSETFESGPQRKMLAVTEEFTNGDTVEVQVYSDNGGSNDYTDTATNSVPCWVTFQLVE
jgi:hypothetical protein